MTTTTQSTLFPQRQSYSEGTTTNRKPGTKDSNSKGIWLSMLDEVSRGKDLAEKQLIILGGTPDQQRDFLSTLHPAPEPTNPRNNRRNNNRTTTTTKAANTPIPISNRFALGYTYHDVLDSDGEDILARLSIYMLSNPSAAFAPLLKPLFTTRTVPNTLVTILLDWEDPFKWPRQLRQWVRVVRSVVEGLEEDVRGAMEEVMRGWKERRLGLVGEGVGIAARTGSVAGESKTPIAPLGPGEWEDELGLPLSVVCLNAEKEERMEKEYGWQEGDFDFVLQWMRCVLLKHGASLIYTTSFDSNNVRTLIHSSLSIQSLLKRETVKHNVIDRDKILIPPNWDSWGKIRILREGFDMETIANAWSVEVQSPPEAEFDASTTKPVANANANPETHGETSSSGEESTISIFTSSLSNPMAKSKPYIPSSAASNNVTVPDSQTFLAEQSQILEALRQEDEHAERHARKTARPSDTDEILSSREKSSAAARAQLDEIAARPYNINVGGIQVDAEEVTRRIREREADRERDGSSNRTPRKEVGVGVGVGGAMSGQGSGVATPDGGKVNNEALASYFAGLMKKAKGSSGSQSPRGGSGNGTASAAER